MREYSSKFMRGESNIQSPVESGRRKLRGGLLPVAGAALCVGGVLVWTMAAHDPYWRLFETDSVPAPAYESPEEIRAALASAAVIASPPDSVAVRPDPQAGRATDGATDGATDLAGPEVALLPRPAEPVIAVPVALSLTAPVDVSPASQDARDEPAGAAPVLASAPPALPAPGTPDAAEPGPGPTIAATVPPAPVVVPAMPAPLWIAADEISEEALALARAERTDVQRRLALAGFDPRGFDGVFGRRTREAIADFQEAWSFPATGYLDSAVYADLRARTEDAYLALASRAAAEPRAAPKIAPLAREREVARNDSGGCARDAEGRIVARQNFGCDLKGFAEKVISLGRNKLPYEEDSMAMAETSTAFAKTRGAER